MPKVAPSSNPTKQHSLPSDNNCRYAALANELAMPCSILALGRLISSTRLTQTDAGPKQPEEARRTASPPYLEGKMPEHLCDATFVPPTGRWGYPRQLDPVRQPMRTKDGYISIAPLKMEAARIGFCPV